METKHIDWKEDRILKHMRAGKLDYDDIHNRLMDMKNQLNAKERGFVEGLSLRTGWTRAQKDWLRGLWIKYLGGLK